MDNNVIFLEPVYKDYIWGGNKLNKLLNKMGKVND